MNRTSRIPASQNEFRVFLQTRWLRILAISAVTLVPCFWHRHLEAGDLSSHIYNAWLAQLIEKGQAPGLYFAHLWTNILFDISLLKLGNLFGLAVAEKVAVSMAVLIFFWGAFGFMAAAAQRAPWILAPALAMLAYGWTFEMGFMNYYLSVGFAFAFLAVVWRGSPRHLLLAGVLAALTLVSHPMGFAWLLAGTIYLKLAEHARDKRRWLLFAGSLLALTVLGALLFYHYQAYRIELASFLELNGTDQLVLYGKRYAVLSWIVLLICCAGFLLTLIRGEERTGPRLFRTPLELWALAFFAATILPETIFFPKYAMEAGYLVLRLTLIAGVVGLALIACVQSPKWLPVSLALCSIVFFTFLYYDTGELNKVETQSDMLVRQLPFGRRVTQTIESPAHSRIFHSGHFVDRACIGHCFVYWNYEPFSKQFRIRVEPGSSIAAATSPAPLEQGTGLYIVQPEVLPLTQVYSCDAANPAKLCMRDLKAGEKILVDR